MRRRCARAARPAVRWLRGRGMVEHAQRELGVRRDVVGDAERLCEQRGDIVGSGVVGDLAGEVAAHPVRGVLGVGVGDRGRAGVGDCPWALTGPRVGRRARSGGSLGLVVGCSARRAALVPSASRAACSATRSHRRACRRRARRSAAVPGGLGWQGGVAGVVVEADAAERVPVEVEDAVGVGAVVREAARGRLAQEDAASAVGVGLVGARIDVRRGDDLDARGAGVDFRVCAALGRAVGVRGVARQGHRLRVADLHAVLAVVRAGVAGHGGVRGQDQVDAVAAVGLGGVVTDRDAVDVADDDALEAVDDLIATDPRAVGALAEEHALLARARDAVVVDRGARRGLGDDPPVAVVVDRVVSDAQAARLASEDPEAAPAELVVADRGAGAATHLDVDPACIRGREPVWSGRGHQRTVDVVVTHDHTVGRVRQDTARRLRDAADLDPRRRTRRAAEACDLEPPDRDAVGGHGEAIPARGAARVDDTNRAGPATSLDRHAGLVDHQPRRVRACADADRAARPHQRQRGRDRCDVRLRALDAVVVDRHDPRLLRRRRAREAQRPRGSSNEQERGHTQTGVHEEPPNTAPSLTRPHRPASSRPASGRKHCPRRRAAHRQPHAGGPRETRTATAAALALLQMCSLARRRQPGGCRSCPSRPGSEVEDALCVCVEECFLFVAGEGRDDLGVGVDDVAVGAVEAVDGPVGAEEAAGGAERVDAFEDPWADRVGCPGVVAHAQAGDLDDGVGRGGDLAHACAPLVEVVAVASSGESGVVDAEGDAGIAVGEVGALGHRLEQWVVAADEAVVFEQRVAASPVLVCEVVVVAQVADAAQRGGAGVGGEHLGDCGVCEVGVGDEAVWDADVVGEALQPARLLDGVVRADSGLDVDDLGDVLVACLGGEVLRVVALRLDCVEVAEILVERIGGEPVVAQRLVREIPEVQVRVDERDLSHTRTSWHAVLEHERTGNASGPERSLQHARSRSALSA